MTRKDLNTGENISLLIFIKSKVNMRQIFDDEPDTEEESVLRLSESLDNTEDYIDPQEMYGMGDFHLR
jgi:hypothetical protein